MIKKKKKNVKLICPLCGNESFITEVKPDPLGQFRCKKCGKVIVKNKKYLSL